MRRPLFGILIAAGFVAACLSALSLTSKPAAALALPAPAGLSVAADEMNVTEKVGCGVVWRCGPWGCGWRQVCWAPRYYYGGWGGPYYRRVYWGGPRYWGPRPWGWGGPRVYYRSWGGGPWGWGGPRYWGPRPWGWGGVRVYRSWGGGWGGGWGWRGPRFYGGYW